MSNQMTFSRTLERERVFKYLLIVPTVFVILLIGLYPLIKLVITSFQDISMFGEDTSFQGFIHYARLFEDDRLWESIHHTILFTVIALPIELVFGYLLALLFLEKLPYKQIFVAIILLPAVISPVVAGATWRLMFDQRYGPINQVIGWIVGYDIKLLWTIDPVLVWPAIMVAEVWQWTPFMFLILLAALSNVNKEQVGIVRSWTK